MDALFRILTILEITDRATGPLGKVVGAFTRLGSVVGAVGGAILGGMGMKSFFDWTVGASANLQQMSMGLAAIMSANSKLTMNLGQANTQIENMRKNGEINATQFRQMSDDASKLARDVQTFNSGMKGLGKHGSMTDLMHKDPQFQGAAANVMESRFQESMGITSKWMDALQQKSIMGIGTLEDYARTANILYPQASKSFGKNMEKNGEDFVNMVHNMQMAAATLLPGYAGMRKYQVAANETSKMLAGAATSQMPFATNLLSGMSTKEFNHLTRPERWNLVRDRLEQFGMLSKFMMGTWQNIVSSIQEFGQYIGRNIGDPLRIALQDAIRGTSLWKSLTGDDGKMGPKTAEEMKASADKVKATWDYVRNVSLGIGVSIVNGVTGAANALVIAAPYIKDAAIAMLVAATAMKASAMYQAAAGMVYNNVGAGILVSKAGAGADAAVMGIGGMLQRLNAAVPSQKLTTGANGALALADMTRRERLRSAAEMAMMHGRNAIHHNPLTNVGANPLARLAGSQNPLTTLINKITSSAPAVSKVASLFGNLASRMMMFTIIGVVVLGVIGLFAVLAGNLGGLRTMLMAAIIPAWNAVKSALASLWPIIRIVIGVVVILAMFLGGILVVALLLTAKIIQFVAQIFSAAMNWICQHVLGMSQTASSGFNAIAGAFAAMVNGMLSVINGAIRGANALGGHIPGFKALTEFGYISAPHVASQLAGVASAMSNPMGMLHNGMNGLADMGAAFRNQHAAGGFGGGIPGAGIEPNTGGDDGDGKKKKGRHPKGRHHHPHHTNVFQRGAIQIEIKNMNNYPPDRIAYDMKRVLMDKVNNKTQATSNGWSGASISGFGGR